LWGEATYPKIPGKASLGQLKVALWRILDSGKRKKAEPATKRGPKKKRSTNANTEEGTESSKRPAAAVRGGYPQQENRLQAGQEKME